MGLLIGAPMRPKEIEDLMQQMNQTVLAHLLPAEHDDGDDPPTPGHADASP
jgi:hypothetical protein